MPLLHVLPELSILASTRFAFYSCSNYRTQKSVTFYRTVILSGIGILAIFGSRIAGFPGSGALIAIVASFVASFKWSSDKVS